MDNYSHNADTQQAVQVQQTYGHGSDGASDNIACSAVLAFGLDDFCQHTYVFHLQQHNCVQGIPQLYVCHFRIVPQCCALVRSADAQETRGRRTKDEEKQDFLAHGAGFRNHLGIYNPIFARKLKVRRYGQRHNPVAQLRIYFALPARTCICKLCIPQEDRKTHDPRIGA